MSASNQQSVRHALETLRDFGARKRHRGEGLEALLALDDLEEQYDDLQRVAAEHIGNAVAFEAENRGLKEQLETLREASLENAEQNAITYRLAHLLGLREEWAGRVPPPAFVDARASIPASAPEPDLEHDPATGWRKGYEGVWSFRGGEWNRLDA